MAILSPTHTHVLLGRQRRWPADFYSTLAGFCEPAESLDEAVRRETWEESGVRVGRVVIHSTQPWPYPASLMIGAIGEAVVGGDEIVLHHDPELVDARWFPLEEVRAALKKATIGIYEAVPTDHNEVRYHVLGGLGSADVNRAICDSRLRLLLRISLCSLL